MKLKLMNMAAMALSALLCLTTTGAMAQTTYKVSVKEGTEDAANWTAKAGEGEYQALPLEGVAAGMAVSVKYNGTKKVKSVKAVKKAAPAATVTTAPTAKTGVKAGQNEAIVNAGTAEGGTMMYKVNATQPASTDGFSATVPTAEGLTAGTYYVWYYVKADDSHTDSEISATGIEVTIDAAGPPAATGHALSASVVGEIVCSDGLAYAAADKDNLPQGVTAVAMVAYVGTESDCTTGLAIALEDVSSSTYTWAAAAGAVTTWATGKTGSWRLPSIKDWQYMFIGCGSGESYSDPEVGMDKSYVGLREKLAAAGGTALEFGWSSTEVEDNDEFAWWLNFDGGSAYFGDYPKDDEENGCFVRACLAF